MNITVFSKTGCPFCVMATEWLTARNFLFNEIKLDTQEERNNKYKETGMSTVPIIFVDDKLIGGYQDLILSELAIDLSTDF